MLFNSWEFLIFFPIVVLIYFLIPKKIKSIWLLAASYYFYMCWNPKYIVLILFSTAATYCSGLGMAYVDRHYAESGLPENRIKLKKKLIIAACFTANLGILAFFKYFDFLLQNLNTLLRGTGVTISNPFNYVLPVGISFFTFQALGYIVDVYRKTIPAEKNFINYALFVAFFPQLVAGPIERSKNLLNDIKNIPKKTMWDYERITSGLIIMVYGMFLKLVVTDRISTVVDSIFNNYGSYNTAALWIGAAGFSIQIYCDFAGYSTIAIGAAKVMGFTLMENFNTPYFSRSIKEFWRRWHISLSTWFKDYLYIPLGGNRCSRIRWYFNLMVTFLVSGVWHGAGWHFVAWGGIHGAYQIIGDILKPARKKTMKTLHLNPDTRIHKLFQTVFTVFLAVIAWVFFRSGSLMDSFRYVKGMFSFTGGNELSGVSAVGFAGVEWIILFASLTVVLLVGLVKYNFHQTIDMFLAKRNIVIRWLVIFVLLFAIIIFGIYGPNYDAQAFIYFQF